MHTVWAQVNLRISTVSPGPSLVPQTKMTVSLEQSTDTERLLFTLSVTVHKRLNYGIEQICKAPLFGDTAQMKTTSHHGSQ